MSTERYGWPRPRHFDIGERVTLTRRARRMGLQGRAKTPHGRVAKIVNGVTVWVKRDGIKLVEPWHTHHWRRIGSWSGGETPDQ